MIHIERPQAPAFLIDPDGSWMSETRRAINWYAPGPQHHKSFEFSYYNHADVKSALRQFFLKCAYCDNYYRGTSDGDVEHFRPKAKVQEKDPQNPGYYWLANDWDNLFLACQHCNQYRKHVLIDTDTIIARGKMDQFPMLNNTGWVTDPNDLLDIEEPLRLLLNPCKDQPENHLAYDMDTGNIIGTTDKGKKSIEVYVLRRKPLVDDRLKVIFHLQQIMDLVRDQLEDFNENPSERNKRRLDKLIALLIGFTLPDKNFAGMARFFVSKFLEENDLK